MSQELDPRVGLSSVEEGNVVHYRTVSRIAVAALVLGLLSAAALVSKLMWCVPIVGVTLAVIALRTIAKDQNVVLGRGAAQVGLVLGLLFFASATTNHFVRQRSLFRQARPHTSRWIEMVREGRLREAHQLTKRQESRQPLGANLQGYYEATRDAREDMEGFFDAPLLAKIVELGREGQLRFDADEEVSTGRERGGNSDLIVQRFAIDHQIDGKPQSLSFVVSINRAYDSDDGEARWRIIGVADPDSADR